MPNEISAIGDLPGVNPDLLPNSVADLPGQVIFEGYRDSYYHHGFALRTEDMGSELRFMCHDYQENRSEIHLQARRHLLDLFGAWQFRTANSLDTLQTAPVGRNSNVGHMHTDGPQETDTLLCQARQNDAFKKTLITTTRLALHLCVEHHHLLTDGEHESKKWEAKVRSLLDMHREYDLGEHTKKAEHWNGGHFERFGRSALERKYQFSKAIAAFDSGVLAHDWSEFQGVMFSNRNTMHMSEAGCSGTIMKQVIR